MLRESAIALGYDLDFTAIADRSVDPGIIGGTQLLDLVDALFTNQAVADARTSIIQALGPESFVDAAAVYANFSMMNRVAEGTGIPVPMAAIDREADIVEPLSLRSMLKH